ncbi:MAG: hypothetical protein HY904_12580 [Deltaproteobacteria bacterium]|nr:hypothetical protein [Deltaproteobacteria bacterium]
MNSVTLAVALAVVTPASAQDALREAAERWGRGDAAGASEAYETAALQGADGPDVYFNLGTAALRAGDVGRATWALLTARRLAPWDDDIAFNLELARRENADSVAGGAEPAWLPWALRLPRAPLQWLAYGLFLAFCALLFVRGLRGPVEGLAAWVVRTGLGALFAAVTAGAVEVTAGAPQAVVVVREATVRSADRADGPEAFRVHAGLTVRPMAKPRAGMMRIRLANGLDGWVEQAAVRVVGAR